MAWDDTKSANDVILSEDWNNMVADQKNRVHKSSFTAKGDIIVGTGSGTFTAQGVGNDNEVLIADSTQTAGVKWSKISKDNLNAVDEPADGEVLSWNATAEQFEWIEGGGGGGNVGGVYGINVETLTGNKTLIPGTDKIYQYLDPNGSDRTITLDTTNASAGDRFVIRNNGIYYTFYHLTITDGENTLDYIHVGSIKEFIFDGSNWVAARNGTGGDDLGKTTLSIGYYSKGHYYGTAIGNSAIGNGYGVAVGFNSYGDTYGISIGCYAKGQDAGVAIGYRAKGGVHRGIAIGFYAGYYLSSPNPNKNILIGYKAGYNLNGSDNNNIIIGYDLEESGGTNNKLNIGDTLIGNLSTKNLIWQATVRYKEIVSDSSSSGSATIDWITGNIHEITLTENTTLSFTDPESPAELTLIIKQDSTGGHSVTFPSNIKWEGGNAPNITTSANAEDIIFLLFDGTNYYGWYKLNFS